MLLTALRPSLVARGFRVVHNAGLPCPTTHPLRQLHICRANVGMTSRLSLIGCPPVISKRGMVPNKFRTQRRSFGDGGEHRQSVFDSADRVLFVLIGTNLVVTTLWSKADTHLRKAMMVAFFTTSIVHLEKGNYHTVFTSMFSHVDLSQLFTNMLGLYFFGRDISHILGSKRFLGLYLAGGVLSSCAALEEQMRSRRVSPNLGANGAVNAITALSILVYPHTTFRVFGILPVRSWFAGSLFIGRDFFDWIGKNRDSLFASLASIGCGGLYYVSMLRNVRRLR